MNKRSMTQTRNEPVSLFECLAVVTALVFQIAALLTMLHDHMPG
jgi:hypothetical protein